MARVSGTTSSGVTEESDENVMNQYQTVTPKIQKVPKFLRERDVFSFKPRIAPFGPIHHRNPDYQSGDGYRCKKELRRAFVSASGKELNVLWGPIKLSISELKNCFDEEVIKDYNEDDLAWLLCKDGCAILQYIYCPPTDKRMFDYIAQDILLLENQIPYKVLKELMQLSDKKEELEKSIAAFIKKHANLPSQPNPQRDLQIDGDHVHLLDLLRTSLLGESQAETPNERRDLLPLRNVRELKAAGIYLRPSSDRFLPSISFKRRFWLGRLYLPPITVNSARLKFLNLVAFEMCFQNDRGVISYLHFLDSLINEPQDVKELRDAGVLYIKYTELQTLFRVLRDAGVLTDDHDAYIGVKEEIQGYYGTLMSKMLQFYHAKIQDSSWPLIVYLTVVLDLLFGSTQTWFTVMNWFSVSPASQSHS